MLIRIMACKEREDNVNKMLSELWEGVEVIWDEKHNANDTLCRTLDSNEAMLVLEDDIELCDNFLERAKAIIEEHKNCFIMFYSVFPEEYIPDWEYEWWPVLTQAYYVPEWIGKRISDFLFHDEYSNRPNQWRYDIGLTAWLKYERTPKFMVKESLVQHMCPESLISPTHPKHTSPTYVWKNNVKEQKDND